MTEYDNTCPSGDPRLAPGRHFKFDVNGRRFVYCYIRKNASSCFKLLIEHLSPYREQRDQSTSSYAFLRKRHTAGPISIESSDCQIFVVRPPFERLTSVYVNKFVQAEGQSALFKSYSEVTGTDPETASFRDFVRCYLTADFVTLDKHVHPQAGHLRRIRYTDAILLDQVHQRMTKLVGPTLGDTFFRKPINSTTASPSLSAADVHDVPAIELQAEYRTSGRLPRSAAFGTDDLQARCRALYAADYALYDRVASGS